MELSAGANVGSLTARGSPTSAARWMNFFFRRRLFVVVILVAGAACAGSAVGIAPPLRLARRARRVSRGRAVCAYRRLSEAKLAFRIPSGGRAVRRRLAARLALCMLFPPGRQPVRSLYSDSHHRVLEVGVLPVVRGAVERNRYLLCPRFAADRGEREVRQLLRGVNREHLLADDEEMVDRRDGAGNQPRYSCQGRPDAQSEWTNNINWCGIKGPGETRPAHYEGETSGAAKRDGKAWSTGAA
jgi:hypothetical protein